MLSNLTAKRLTAVSHRFSPSFKTTLTSSRRLLCSTSSTLSAHSSSQDSHHHEDSHAAEEENLFSNPNYIYIFSGVGVFSLALVLDSYYASTHDSSFIGSLVTSPTTSAEILTANVKLTQSIEEAKKVTDVMFLNPHNQNGLRDLNGLTNTFKKSGFPFNYAPGDHFDTESVGGRRQPKSVFDSSV